MLSNYFHRDLHRRKREPLPLYPLLAKYDGKTDHDEENEETEDTPQSEWLQLGQPGN